MGKVVYATGIDYVQGALSKPTKKNGHKCGSYLIGTHRTAPTENPECTRLYIHKEDVYDRSTPVTSKEISNRSRFAAISRAVKDRKEDLSKLSADQAAFIAQKDEPNGKKTMLAWYWMVCGEEYDQANG